MIYCNKDNVFHLQTKDTSYLLRALPSGQLESLYYGKKLRNVEDFTFLYDKHEAGYSNASPRSQQDTSLSLDHIALEGQAAAVDIHKSAPGFFRRALEAHKERIIAIGIGCVIVNPVHIQ